VPQGRATLNSPASGIRSAIIHRTVSGAHRTVRYDSGATATSRATVDCNALNARLHAQRSRACAGGTPDSLQGLSGAPPDSQAGPQVRAATVEPQRSADVASAPDSVRWHTRLYGAPCDSTLPTAIFGGWGYKYPNHPTFNGIQVFYTSTPYKSYSIQYKTHQRDQILSQLHTKL
jgi:hypothetical protein